MFNKKIRLPISVAEYDTLVAKLVKKYGFAEPNHVSAVISVAIRHIDNQTAYTTYDYLAQCVWKQMANHVANHKGELIKHAVQVDQLVSMFKQDPNNQQVLDQLSLFASQGSDYAKAELDKIQFVIGKKSDLSLVPTQSDQA
jgi:hypothetical protein